MKILFVGEIVAKPGRNTVKEVLPEVIKKYKPDLVLANVENLVGGRGVTLEKLDEMKAVGIDYFTSGDHVFWLRNVGDFIDDYTLIRPANYPEDTIGKGYDIIDTGAKGEVLLINLMGRTSFGGPKVYLDDPFRKADKILEEFKDREFAAIVVDFHAEGTSEKYALAIYLDGRVDIFVGSHSHVPSADTMVMPKGTLYVTDIGMTGIIDSVLGVKSDIIIQMFLTAQNQRFEWESTGRNAFRSVLFDTETSTVSRVDKLID